MMPFFQSNDVRDAIGMRCSGENGSLDHHPLYKKKPAPYSSQGHAPPLRVTF